MPQRPRLHDPERQASYFGRVRAAHQTEVAEDYVELIADLIAVKGEARAADLANRLGVAAPTVNNTIQRLSQQGLVESRPYRSIFLTEKGREMARAARERHVLVRDFLLWIGVDSDTAEGDAEGIEHHVSETTLKAFARMLGRAD